MQFYKNGFRGGNPYIKEAAPNRRNRGINEPLPEKVDVLISGTALQACVWLRSCRNFQRSTR
jgi:hypothetical protein